MGAFNFIVISGLGFRGRAGFWGTSGWGVLIYKSVSDLLVTMEQPRDKNFMGRTTFIWSNFFIIRFAHIKNCPFNFFVFQKEKEKKT